MTDALPTGVATGVGSMPGEDIEASLGLVFSELPDCPYLPELPARGPGSDMIGRASAALVDLHVDLQPSGWRLTTHAGLDERRAAERLERDIDALSPVAATHDGPLKVQLAGPLTLAASLERARGDRAVADAGALRDIADSLAEGARQHLEEVRRRAPHARLLLQLDEPALPAVLDGRLPTASGFGSIAALDPTAARQLLRTVIEGAGVPVVLHCCAAGPPLGLMHSAGSQAVSFDLIQGRPDHDAIGEIVEAGGNLWLGVVPSLGPGAAPSAGEVAARVRRLWGELGFAAEMLPDRIVLTPTCGLAGASPGWATTAMRLLQQVARVLREAPEGVSR